MSILFIILFGALVGWIASLIMGTDAKQGALANIALGIIGAMLGSFIAGLIGGNGVTGANISSFAWALLGSVILLGIYRAFSNVNKTSVRND
jgi:uncharacterized membrane protein YeaQ/YmgE (transglycosylase-associated protein family)